MSKYRCVFCHVVSNSKQQKLSARHGILPVTNQPKPHQATQRHRNSWSLPPLPPFAVAGSGAGDVLESDGDVATVLATRARDEEIVMQPYADTKRFPSAEEPRGGSPCSRAGVVHKPKLSTTFQGARSIQVLQSAATTASRSAFVACLSQLSADRSGGKGSSLTC